MKTGGNIHVSKDAGALSRAAAEWIVDYIKVVLDKNDRFTIALSGGSTPKKLFELLATEKYSSQIEWSRIHFFWGDERHVPFTDDRNNAKMAFDTLLSKVPVLESQVHKMNTALDPDAASNDYEHTLRTYFQESGASFDLVMLGLGDNAHTLSLFPGYDNIHEKKKWVMNFYLAEQDTHRITLTAPIVNRAARVMYLVAGASKAVPVYEVLYGEHEPDLYPAQLIQPYSEKPYWFLDKAAAFELEK
jgi:6-phosphogluconolactonase